LPLHDSLPILGKSEAVALVVWYFQVIGDEIKLLQRHVKSRMVVDFHGGRIDMNSNEMEDGKGTEAPSVRTLNTSREFRSKNRMFTSSLRNYQEVGSRPNQSPSA